VTLEGVLASEAPAGALAAVSVTRFDPLDGAELAPACGRLPGLVLVCDNGRVSLDGDVEMVSVSPGRSPDDDALLGDGAFDGVRAGSRGRVRVGDRVVVRGVVHSRSGDDVVPSGYRGAPPGWRLGAGAAGRVLLQALVEAQPMPKARARVAGAAMGLVLLHGLLVALGAYALRAGEVGRGPIVVEGRRPYCEDRARGWASLATATPWLRKRALEAFAVRLRCAPLRDRSLGRRLGQLAARAGASDEAQADAMLSVGEVRGAADRLAGLSAPAARIRAASWYLALAEFEKARALLSPPDSEALSGVYGATATAHLLAGNRVGAARALRAWTARIDRLQTSGVRMQQMRSLNCLAGVLEAEAAGRPREAGFDEAGRCVVGFDPAVHAAAERVVAMRERSQLFALLDARSWSLPRPPRADEDFGDWCERLGVPPAPELRQWLRARDRVQTMRWVRAESSSPRRSLAALTAAVSQELPDRSPLVGFLETEVMWRVPFEPYATAMLGRQVAGLLHAVGDDVALSEHNALVARLQRAVRDDTALLGWRLIERY